MFEAKLDQAAILKKIVDAIRDLVTDCNFDCSESGIALQALDNSHIVLVSLLLGSDGFSEYRSDRAVTLGININSIATILRCSANDDVLTLRSGDKPNVLTVAFEDTKRDRVSEFNLKLMDIDQEYLSIPDAEYTASITMPATELQRICRDFKAISDSMRIEATKEGVVFSTEGDLGDGSVHLKQYTDIENKDNSVIVNISEPVSLNFNLTFFNHICKASSLSSTVTVHMHGERPTQIEYTLPNGYLRYYFAPKISEDDNE
jgi:proliferating cell nuclear antigen